MDLELGMLTPNLLPIFVKLKSKKPLCIRCKQKAKSSRMASSTGERTSSWSKNSNAVDWSRFHWSWLTTIISQSSSSSVFTTFAVESASLEAWMSWGALILEAIRRQAAPRAWRLRRGTKRAAKIRSRRETAKGKTTKSAFSSWQT